MSLVHTLKLAYSGHTYVTLYTIHFLHSLNFVNTKEVLFVVDDQEKIWLYVYIFFNVAVLYMYSYLFPQDEDATEPCSIWEWSGITKITVPLATVYLILAVLFLWWYSIRPNAVGIVNIWWNLYMALNMLLASHRPSTFVTFVESP